MSGFQTLIKVDKDLLIEETYLFPKMSNFLFDTLLPVDATMFVAWKKNDDAMLALE